ncbi:MAG: dipicolinate synthase subunit B [Clostridia bacterium]|nr:dipicolinate synthase subunit B [Clostridia bacterium]
MTFDGLRIGFAMTGSFCTFSKVMKEIETLRQKGAMLVPIMSEMVWNTDTRFGKAEEFIEKFKDLSQRDIIHTIKDAEPIGPKNLLDALIIAPCTGNTISKIANGITDSCVAMAAKATLRNNAPVIIAVSTNDGLGSSAKNIGTLLNKANIYFVPFGQDDPKGKPNSLVADMTKIAGTLEEALEGRQIQPLIIER